MSPAPTAMTVPPAAASVPLGPGPVPPPVAGAPAGAFVVAPGVADVAVPVEVPVGVPAGVGGQVTAAVAAWVAVLAGVVAKVTGVHASHLGCCSPDSDSQAIGVPLAATPEVFTSASGQSSPAS